MPKQGEGRQYVIQLPSSRLEVVGFNNTNVNGFHIAARRRGPNHQQQTTSYHLIYSRRQLLASQGRSSAKRHRTWQLQPNRIVALDGVNVVQRGYFWSAGTLLMTYSAACLLLLLDVARV